MVSEYNNITIKGQQVNFAQYKTQANRSDYAEKQEQMAIFEAFNKPDENGIRDNILDEKEIEQIKEKLTEAAHEDRELSEEEARSLLDSLGLSEIDVNELFEFAKSLTEQVKDGVETVVEKTQNAIEDSKDSNTKLGAFFVGVGKSVGDFVDKTKTAVIDFLEEDTDIKEPEYETEIPDEPAKSAEDESLSEGFGTLAEIEEAECAESELDIDDVDEPDDDDNGVDDVDQPDDKDDDIVRVEEAIEDQDVQDSDEVEDADDADDDDDDDLDSDFELDEVEDDIVRVEDVDEGVAEVGDGDEPDK